MMCRSDRALAVPFFPCLGSEESVLACRGRGLPLQAFELQMSH